MQDLFFVKADAVHLDSILPIVSLVKQLPKDHVILSNNYETNF